MSMAAVSTTSNKVILQIPSSRLKPILTREEAEVLLADLSHALQDMDVTIYSSENGETQEQP